MASKSRRRYKDTTAIILFYVLLLKHLLMIEQLSIIDAAVAFQPSPKCLNPTSNYRYKYLQLKREKVQEIDENSHDNNKVTSFKLLPDRQNVARHESPTNMNISIPEVSNKFGMMRSFVETPAATMNHSQFFRYENRTKAPSSKSNNDKNHSTKTEHDTSCKGNTKSLVFSISHLLRGQTLSQKNDIQMAISQWIKDSFWDSVSEDITHFVFDEIGINPVGVFEEISIDILVCVLDSLLATCRTKESFCVLANRCEILNEMLYDRNLDRTYYHCFLAIRECYRKAMDGGKAHERNSDKEFSESMRIAECDFGIDDNTVLHNNFDLERFSERVKQLFEWYGNCNQKNHQHFIAPYFCLIQSSGTGETLLLDKFNQKANKTKNVFCKLFICDVSIFERKPKRHTVFEFKSIRGTKGLPDRAKFWKYLDSWLPKRKKRVVFLFDEAQSLLDDDAVYFRYLRWWLRQKRDDGIQIVAVFSGTTVRLANFFPELPKQGRDSRNPVDIIEYYNENQENLVCYDSFFDLTTMGCFIESSEQSNSQQTEYGRAAMYSRPLFAKLQVNMRLDSRMRGLILRRMLFDQSNSRYERDASVLVNILGTRVQMGHVSSSLASKLISRAFAHLVSFRAQSSDNYDFLKCEDDMVQICFIPDPVCAHLAMCLMDKDWKHNEICGREPKFWTKKAQDLFSSGICHPRKGDVGEVATAMYLLFCGDAIRKKVDKNYMKFSVDLAQYVQQMIKNKSENLNSKSATTNSAKSSDNYLVSFIQFSRQNLYVSLRDLCHQQILERLYTSACALYLPSQTPTFDLLASIKCNNGRGNDEFIPFALCVKSHHTFGSGDVADQIIKMERAMEECGILRALCLVVLLESKNNDSYGIGQHYLIDLCDVDTELTSGIVCKVLVINWDDQFGISKFAQTIYAGDCASSDVYLSHWMTSAVLPFSVKQASHNCYNNRNKGVLPTHTTGPNNNNESVGVQNKQEKKANNKKTETKKKDLSVLVNKNICFLSCISLSHFKIENISFTMWIKNIYLPYYEFLYTQLIRL